MTYSIYINLLKPYCKHKTWHDWQHMSITEYIVLYQIIRGFRYKLWNFMVSVCADWLKRANVTMHRLPVDVAHLQPLSVFCLTLSTVSSFSLETQYHTQCSRGFSFGSVKLFYPKIIICHRFIPYGFILFSLFFKMPTQSQRWHTLGLSMPRTLWWWKERAPV